MTDFKGKVYPALSLIITMAFLQAVPLHPVSASATGIGSADNGKSGTATVELNEVKKDADGDGNIDMIGDTVTVSGISNIASGILHEQYLQIFIQDEKSGLSLFTESFDQPIARGDSIVATGVVQDYFSLIELNVIDYRVYPSSNRELTPRPLADALANLSDFEGMLVGGTGTVVGKGNQYNGKYLLVSPLGIDGETIMAYVTNFHSRYQDFDFESISEGDEIKVAGVLTKYTPEPDDENSLTYKIHLRTPADLAIVGLSLNQMVIWGSLGLTLILLVVGWIISLRSTVRTKTKELQQSLHDKEILLKEIHHRVKNNLAIMSGLFELQLDSTENKETEKALRNSQSRLKSMALVHDKLYQTSSLSEIEMAHYIPDLIKSLRDTFESSIQNVELHFDIDDICLNIDHAIPCGLLINEIVVNAFKHAFQQADDAIISVSMHRDENRVTLTIADNGKGLPENLDITKSTSLGMMLIETFRDQLDGDLDISADNGTCYTLEFSVD